MRSIIFDIGWVLLHLRPQPLLDLLARHGATFDHLEQVTSRIPLLEHESGQIDGAGLLRHLAALAPQPPDSTALHAAWIDMFEPQAAVFELAARLRERYRVFLLSNVGDLHWAHIGTRYRLQTLAHDVIRSYAVGLIKPDQAIYALAERRFELDPATTVFIDDRAENVAAAQARGWRAIQHRRHDQTLEALHALGIQTE
jgi:HAD superfamily hydrolase (TIGR01509 family)